MMTLEQIINQLWEPHLTSIDLSSSYIGRGAIAEVLKHNTTLTSIGLENAASEHDYDMRPIAEALKHNSTLTYINLSDAQSSLEDIQAIAEALQFNTTLTSICFSSKCSTEQLQMIADALQYNTTLTSISFSDYYDDDYSEGDYYDKLHGEIYKKTQQNKSMQTCYELWILEKREFDSFLQWLPREVLEDTLRLLTNKKTKPSVENSQLLSPSSPSFFKRKRQDESVDPFFEEERLLPLQQRRRSDETESDSTPSETVNPFH